MLDIKNRETLEIYVLGDDFKFYQNLKYLPLTSYPSNIQSALIVYCLSGRAKLTVHEDVHWIQPEELIIGEFYQFNLSSCIRQQNSLTAQFVSFNLSNLANIFYPPQFLQ